MQDTAEGFGQPIRHIFDAFFSMRRELPSPFDEHPVYRVTVEDRFWGLLYQPLARAVKRSDLRHVLPEIRCPVTLIWGRNDVITPPAVAHEFARHLPSAELHFIDRCGHTPPMERPEEFHRIFRASLERLIA